MLLEDIYTKHFGVQRLDEAEIIALFEARTSNVAMPNDKKFTFIPPIKTFNQLIDTLAKHSLDGGHLYTSDGKYHVAYWSTGLEVYDSSNFFKTGKSGYFRFDRKRLYSSDGDDPFDKFFKFQFELQTKQGFAKPISNKSFDAFNPVHLKNIKPVTKRLKVGSNLSGTDLLAMLANRQFSTMQRETVVNLQPDGYIPDLQKKIDNDIWTTNVINMVINADNLKADAEVISINSEGYPVIAVQGFDGKYVLVGNTPAAGVKKEKGVSYATEPPEGFINPKIEVGGYFENNGKIFKVLGFVGKATIIVQRMQATSGKNDTPQNPELEVTDTPFKNSVPVKARVRSDGNTIKPEGYNEVYYQGKNRIFSLRPIH